MLMLYHLKMNPKKRIYDFQYMLILFIVMSYEKHVTLFHT